ncbi:E1A [Bat mastadenovirus G]|uniref:E1A n=1 Tax=Bat mastadenovirus G TaxID=2015376 RepID=A0A1J0FAN1_9ADEN|nr:E1A [Bat mastadenovirus G]APC26053.1 E1A [Bat mastadenovirus G]
MKLSVLASTVDLEDFVADLLEEWRPDLPPSRSPSPPTLHDLYDLSPSPPSPDVDVVVIDSESDTDTAPEACSRLSTPAVSPLPPISTSPAALTEDMLLCLEEMATFDGGDEVRSETSSFERWGASFEPDQGLHFGCLRCAFFQERGESSICGLCYLKALSEVPFQMPSRPGPPAASGELKRPCSTSSSESSLFSENKRACLDPGVSAPPAAEQTEPLDLSTKPRPR